MARGAAAAAAAAAAVVVVVVAMFAGSVCASGQVDIEFVGNHRYTELLTGKSPALINVCPYPVEIMRHTVQCDLESDIHVALEWANEVGPSNKSAEGYAILDIALEFLKDNPGAVPVSDIWGYTGETGHAVAIVGAGNGFSIVDVTVPQAPMPVGFFPGYFTVWRDAKVYDHYAYLVHDQMYGTAFMDSLVNVKPEYKAPFTTGDGLLIVDLEFPRSPKLVASLNGDFEFAHNIYIEPDRPYAYVCGGDVTKGGTDAGGIRVYDITDPTNPVSVATWSDYYVHDLVVQYREDIKKYVLYACGINEVPPDDSLFLLDASNPEQGLATLSTWATTYELTHNAWPTVNNEYLYVTHEDIGAPVTVFDIRDVHDVKEVNELFLIPGNTGVSAHNAFVLNDQLWISYYTEGVAVYDISVPQSPVLAGQYQTSHLNTGFGGSWGVYPFAPSGLIYASDMQHGLFVLNPKAAAPAPAPIPAPAPPTSLSGVTALGSIALIISIIAGALAGFVFVQIRSSQRYEALP